MIQGEWCFPALEPREKGGSDRVMLERWANEDGSLALRASFVGVGAVQSHRASTQEGPMLGLMFCCHHLGILNSSTVLHWVPQIKGPNLRAIHSLWGRCPGSELPVLSLCLHEQERDGRTERVALGRSVFPSIGGGKDIWASIGQGDTVIES